MVLFGLIAGIVTSEIISAYWRSRCPNPPKVYAFNRRIHHGEIGTLLTLSALLLRRTNPVVSIAAAVLTGIGLGLIKDDHADVNEWFKTDQNEREKEKDRNIVIGIQRQMERYDEDSEEEQEKLQSMQRQIRSLIDTQEEDIELEIERTQSILRQVR